MIYRITHPIHIGPDTEFVIKTSSADSEASQDRSIQRYYNTIYVDVVLDVESEQTLADPAESVDDD